MAAALRVVEPRLKPQGNTFLNQERNPSENKWSASARLGGQASRRSYSYSDYVPYHLVAEPLSPIRKPVAKYKSEGSACSQWRNPMAPQLLPSTYSVGGGSQSDHYEEAEFQPSPLPLDGEQEVLGLACGWTQAPRGLVLGHCRPQPGWAEAEGDHADSKDSSSTEAYYPDMDSEDPWVPWPDTDDEDGDGLASKATAESLWPGRVQDLVTPGPATPCVSFVQAQDCGAATLSLPMPSPGGGCTPSRSPACAVLGDPVRFFPAASPANTALSPLGDCSFEGTDSSPSAVNMSSWLRALRHARDGATVSNIDSVRDMLQQSPAVPPFVPLAHDAEAAEVGAPRRRMSSSCSVSSAEAPAIEHCPYKCQYPEASQPVQEKRSYAAGAAPPREGERPPLPMAARAEQRHAVIATEREGAVTTLMVRNLPLHLSQQRLIEELNISGFANLYDFCYSPLCSFDTGRGKGFAFVNFTTEEAASNFVAAWHGTRRFGVLRSEPAMNISAAAVQGKAANLAKWGTKRAVRIRNPKLRPFVRD